MNNHYENKNKSCHVEEIHLQIVASISAAEMDHNAYVPVKWSALLEKLQIQPKYKIAHFILHKSK